MKQTDWKPGDPEVKTYYIKTNWHGIAWSLAILTVIAGVIIGQVILSRM